MIKYISIFSFLISLTVCSAVKDPSVKLDIELKTENFRSTKLKMIVPFGESGTISHGNTKIGNQTVKVTPSRKTIKGNSEILLKLEIAENGKVVARPEVLVSDNSPGTMTSTNSEGKEVFKLKITPKVL